MPLKGLTIIGEKINASLSKIEKILKSHDYAKIQRIAKKQAIKGAHYIDVNVGLSPKQELEIIIKSIQSITTIPLSIDDANPLKLQAGLDAYNIDKSNGLPILNSATEARSDAVFSLRKKKPCQVVILISERLENSRLHTNTTAKESYQTAKRLYNKALDYDFKPEHIFFDPGAIVLASDYENKINIDLDTIKMINLDPELQQTHMLVGLSNLTQQLPKKTKLPLQNAFLTLAMKNGLDTIIGSASRKHEILNKDNEYVNFLNQFLDADGYKKLRVLRKLYEIT